MIRMHLARALPLAALAAMALAAPAQAASLLDTKVQTAGTTARVCHAKLAEGAPGVATKRVTAPVRGTLGSRLTAASGDWDLGVFDARTGSYVAGSAGPGPAEVASGPATEGQPLIVQACRRPGGARTAELAAQLTPTPAPSTEPIKLVRVSTPNRASKRKLQSLDLDLTEHGRETFLEVVTHGAADERKLRDAGFQYKVQVPDMAARGKQVERLDRVYAAGADTSGFPSGRTGYRNLADYEAELKALAEKNPRIVKLIELPNKTAEGRTVKGIEITEDVNVRDGKPVFLQMGAHHAREWPSAEHAMEWAYEMINGYNGGNARAKRIVQNGRTIIVPVVNVDGFNFSRGTGAAPGPETGGPRPDLSDPTPAYKRKNCNSTGQGNAPSCAPRQSGVDPNRNYGGFWGGPGAGTNPSDETYRGTGPFSEPETKNIKDLVGSRQVTTLITNHTFSNLLLRPPGIAAQGPPPDEPIYKALGDRMAQENKYASKPSYGLYDTTGGTEDWTYYATGGLGFTFEIGKVEFHPPYEQVVNEWNGTNARSEAGASGQEGGNKEAYYIAAEHTLDDTKHGELTGDAPGGAILRLKKTFRTPTSQQLPNNGGAITFEDGIESSYRVPDSGKVGWHVNPSTRPLVAGKPPIGPFGSAGPSSEQTFGPNAGEPKIPCALADPQPPTCIDDREVVVEGPPKDNGFVTFRLDWTSPSTDYDMVVFRKKADGTLEEIGSSGQGETTFEQYTQLNPEPGTYVVRVVYFATPGPGDPYKGKVTFAPSKQAEGGTKEPYSLTCEDPEGKVLESKQIQVDRGQKVDIGKVDCVRRGADSRARPALKQKASVRKLSRRRFRVSAKGTLTGVRDRACGGVVSIDVKVKTRRAILRRVRVKRDCTYAKKVTFSQSRIPRKLRAKRKQRFKVVGRYAGTPSLKPTRAVTNTRSRK